MTGVQTCALPISAASGANARERGPSEKTQPAPPTNASNTADSKDVGDSVYRTDKPTYSHVAILVDISFLSVRALEVLENRVSTDLFEIEKARSNLITKIIALGMVTSIVNLSYVIVASYTIVRP